MHTTDGYMLGTYLTAKWVLDLKEEDTYWCAADIGWVTGHSYIVYGPRADGATSCPPEALWVFDASENVRSPTRGNPTFLMLRQEHAASSSGRHFLNLSTVR